MDPYLLYLQIKQNKNSLSHSLIWNPGFEMYFLFCWRQLNMLFFSKWQRLRYSFCSHLFDLVLFNFLNLLPPIVNNYWPTNECLGKRNQNLSDLSSDISARLQAVCLVLAENSCSENAHVFSRSCPMIPDVEVSLSHLSYSVINDLGELSLSEGDLASQFLLLSACQLRGSFFSLQAGSRRDLAICLPVLFLHFFPVQTEFQDDVWWE